MSSVTNIPGEARCKQLVHQLLAGQVTCTSCNGTLSWKREYGWCRSCRTKVRPNDQAAKLSGVVEVDEAWFGKKKFGGQTIVVGAIERDTKRLKL